MSLFMLLQVLFLVTASVRTKSFLPLFITVMGIAFVMVAILTGFLTPVLLAVVEYGLLLIFIWLTIWPGEVDT